MSKWLKRDLSEFDANIRLLSINCCSKYECSLYLFEVCFLKIFAKQKIPHSKHFQNKSKLGDAERN